MQTSVFPRAAPRTKNPSQRQEAQPARLIVNLVPRHIRPIVRGNARAAVELGALPHGASACGRLVFNAK